MLDFRLLRREHPDKRKGVRLELCGTANHTVFGVRMRIYNQYSLERGSEHNVHSAIELAYRVIRCSIYPQSRVQDSGNQRKRQRDTHASEILHNSNFRL